MGSSKDYHLSFNAANAVSCGCPGATPGKIKVDISAHLSNCPIRKKLITEKCTTDTFVYSKLTDGYRLGVAA